MKKQEQEVDCSVQNKILKHAHAFANDGSQNNYRVALTVQLGRRNSFASFTAHTLTLTQSLASVNQSINQ